MPKLHRTNSISSIYEFFDPRDNTNKAIEILKNTKVNSGNVCSVRLDRLKKFAVKTAKMLSDKGALDKEIDSISKLPQHPNIATYVAATTKKGVLSKIAIIMDSAFWNKKEETISLHKILVIFEHNPQSIPTKLLYTMLKSFCSGILALDEKGFQHLDLHLGNIILFPDGNFKLTDIELEDIASNSKIDVKSRYSINRICLYHPNMLKKYPELKIDGYTKWNVFISKIQTLLKKIDELPEEDSPLKPHEVIPYLRENFGNELEM